jgi:hypothetical protein
MADDDPTDDLPAAEFEENLDDDAPTGELRVGDLYEPFVEIRWIPPQLAGITREE